MQLIIDFSQILKGNFRARNSKRPGAFSKQYGMYVLNDLMNV